MGVGSGGGMLSYEGMEEAMGEEPESGRGRNSSCPKHVSFPISGANLTGL